MAILATALAATFFLQAGVTLVDLISMSLLVVAAILLLVRVRLAGEIVAIVGALLTGGNAGIKAIFNAETDEVWMVIQIAVVLLAAAVVVFGAARLKIAR